MIDSLFENVSSLVVRHICDAVEGAQAPAARESDDAAARTDDRWSALGAGKSQMTVATLVAQLGGNVRVGLEDSLWIGKGRLAKSNGEQVSEARRIIEGLGLQVASPDEARKMLGLKGG